MKPLFGYLFLAMGISFGIASNSFAKISEGFSTLYPSLACIFFMFICLFSLSKAMTGCNVVFHLAALIGIPYSYISPLAYIRTNVEGIYYTSGSGKESQFVK